MPYYTVNSGMSGKILGFDFGRSSTKNHAEPFAVSKPKFPSLTGGDRQPNMEHFKRSSISALGGKHGSSDGKEKERSSSKDKRSKTPRTTAAAKPVKLDMVMESPPALFLDPPQHSSGALISGRLLVTPSNNGWPITIESITMYLEATVSTYRPVHDRCGECETQISDLYEWNFFSKPRIFNATGMQELPFSYLIPGHLPVTTHGHIGSIDYSLHVRAKDDKGAETEFRRPLPVLRALRPANDKSSMRIFPPMDLILHVTLPSMIHPIGDFLVQCRMSGITSKRGEDTQIRWRLRKLTWRIEEHEKAVSPACAKHADKVGGEGKGVQHGSTRDVGSAEMKTGWKTDFEAGEIEGEFKAAVDIHTKPQCDVESPNGLMITHCLVLELVIAEEWAPNRKPTQATPTGSARVLRTQFNLSLTERSGMGIAWDDEMPPMYEDVPASPPHYAHGGTTVADYEGDDLHEEVERMNLNQ